MEGDTTLTWEREEHSFLLATSRCGLRPHEAPVTARLGAHRLRGSSPWAGWQQNPPAAGRSPGEAPMAAATATGSAEDLLSHSAALAALPPDSSACKAQGKTNYNARDRYKSKGRIVCTEVH